MAESLNYYTRIEGSGISGGESIYTKRIWTPAKYIGAAHIDIPFTKVQKVVTAGNKNGIVGDGSSGQCFIGNEKQYDIKYNVDYVPNPMSRARKLKARFSWFSVFIENETLTEIDERRGWRQEPGDLFCQSESRYGTELFTANFYEMIRAYENCCQEKAEISVLGTYVYRREVMHAFVIAPTGIDRFADHQRVATRIDDERFDWNDNLPGKETIFTSPETGMYNWKTFSTIAWDGARSGTDRYHNWGHLTFAFYLDCLPNETFVIPYDIGSWKKCEISRRNLVTDFIRDRDDANTDDDIISEIEGEDLLSLVNKLETKVIS